MTPRFFTWRVAGTFMGGHARCPRKRRFATDLRRAYGACANWSKDPRGIQRRWTMTWLRKIQPWIWIEGFQRKNFRLRRVLRFLICVCLACAELWLSEPQRLRLLSHWRLAPRWL